MSTLGYIDTFRKAIHYHHTETTSSELTIFQRKKIFTNHAISSPLNTNMQYKPHTSYTVNSSPNELANVPYLGSAVQM